MGTYLSILWRLLFTGLYLSILLGATLMAICLSIFRSWGASLMGTDRQKQARVAKLRICRDRACSFATTPHLLVDVVDVPLHRDNAMAISYAWGEFDRQKRTVGHTVQPAEPIQLELGTEWIISDVVNRLAELSEAKPVWMDQLCIPQEEDKILKTLADIPSIFSSLDVVVLFPGSPCSCLPRVVEQLNMLPNDNQGRKDQGQVEECLRRQYRCLSLGGSPWSLRMWPRQEFMNSQRIRCVWASKTENPCAILNDGDPNINVETLPPFQRNMLEILTRNNFSQKTAFRAIFDYLQIMHSTIARDLLHYLGSSSRGGEEEQYYRFLRGEQFRKPHHSSFESFPVMEFLLRLSYEAGGQRGRRRTRREATRARDYIISVWTACPNYIVPKAYKSMSVAELMQDAVDQLQCNHRMTIAVTAPRGLFDSESAGSALWNPLEYLSEVDPHCDVDVYRVLTMEGLALPVSREMQSFVPVLLHDAAQLSLSTSARSYKMLVNQFQEMLSHEHEHSSDLSNRFVSRMVIEHFRQIMSHWEENRVQAVSYATERILRESYTTMDATQSTRVIAASTRYVCRIQPIERYMKFLCDHHRREPFDEDEAYAQELDDLIDSSNPRLIYHAIYNVVTAALELDSEYCEKKNVQLIFSLIQNGERWLPRVGFCRGDVHIEDILSGGRKTITVSMGGYDDHPSTLLYEAVHIDSESEKLRRPAYQVFAVWVPTKKVADDEFGAYAKLTNNDLCGKNFGVLL